MLLFRMAWSDALQGHAKCYFSEWHGQIPGRNTRSDAWQGCAECTFYSCMPVTTVHPLRQFTALWVTPIIRWSFQPPTFPTSCTHGLNLLHFQPYVHMDSTSYISNLMYTWTQPPTFPTPQTLGLKLLHFQPPCTHALKMPTFPTLPTLMPWRCPRFQHHQPSCTHALKLSVFPMLPTLVYTGNKKPSRQWEDWGKGGSGGKYRKKKKSKQSISTESGVLGSGSFTEMELHKSRNTYYSRSKAVLFFHLNMLDQPGITLHICGWGLQLWNSNNWQSVFVSNN